MAVSFEMEKERTLLCITGHGIGTHDDAHRFFMRFDILNPQLANLLKPHSGEEGD